MTDRPDVAALAAALDAVERPPYVPTRHIRGVLVAHRYEAAKVIAALAAQGWRITSAPEDSDEASSPASGEAKSEVVTADDPVSAQAAPAYIECPCCGKLWTAALAPNFQRATANIEQAAVRAALEGLRAEVAVMPEATFASVWRADVLRAIDARLAALDA